MLPKLTSVSSFPIDPKLAFKEDTKAKQKKPTRKEQSLSAWQKEQLASQAIANAKDDLETNGASAQQTKKDSKKSQKNISFKEQEPDQTTSSKSKRTKKTKKTKTVSQGKASSLKEAPHDEELQVQLKEDHSESQAPVVNLKASSNKKKTKKAKNKKDKIIEEMEPKQPELSDFHSDTNEYLSDGTLDDGEEEPILDLEKEITRSPSPVRPHDYREVFGLCDRVDDKTLTALKHNGKQLKHLGQIHIYKDKKVEQLKKMYDIAVQDALPTNRKLQANNVYNLYTQFDQMEDKHISMGVIENENCGKALQDNLKATKVAKDQVRERAKADGQNIVVQQAMIRSADNHMISTDECPHKPRKLDSGFEDYYHFMIEHLLPHARLECRKPNHCKKCWQVWFTCPHTFIKSKYTDQVVNLTEIFLVEKQVPRPLLEAKHAYYKALGFNPNHDRQDIEHLKMPPIVLIGNNKNKKEHTCLVTGKGERAAMYMEHYQLKKNHEEAKLALLKARAEASLKGSNGSKKCKAMKALEDVKKLRLAKMNVPSVEPSLSEDSAVMLGKRKFKIEKEWLDAFNTVEIEYANGKILKKRADKLKKIILSYKELMFKKTK